MTSVRLSRPREGVEDWYYLPRVWSWADPAEAGVSPPRREARRGPLARDDPERRRRLLPRIIPDPDALLAVFA